MPFKRILPRIFLVTGLLLLLAAAAYRNQIGRFSSFNLQKAKIHIDNFFYFNAGALRHKPVTFLERETQLNLYVGEPFRSFNKKDWGEFWEIIYGAYPLDSPEKPGLPRRLRQMDQGEIAYELAVRYPQPFAYFTREHWNILFGIIFAKNES